MSLHPARNDDFAQWGAVSPSDLPRDTVGLILRRSSAMPWDTPSCNMGLMSSVVLYPVTSGTSTGPCPSKIVFLYSSVKNRKHWGDLFVGHKLQGLLHILVLEQFVHSWYDLLFNSVFVLQLCCWWVCPCHHILMFSNAGFHSVLRNL